ncbi:MAG TPA: hypothetical protein VFR20_13240 [Burkholderiaceae bacterium]|nr:hypothetical protein [Burkholderiaceae bacterium]
MTQFRTSLTRETLSRFGRRGASLCALVLLTASPLTGYCSPDLASTSELPPSEYSNASLKASSVQFGYYNTSHISQTGARQTAEVNQSGVANTASITQTGLNDQAIANQFGNGNSTFAYQSASGVGVMVNQFGNQNEAMVVQTQPSPVPLVVNQIGNGYRLNVIR